MITATIPYPPTANKLFANAPGKGRVKTAEYRSWITAAGYVLKIAAAAKRIDGPYTLTLRIGKPDNRKRDLGNLTKPIEDLIVALGLVRDDSDCQRIETSWSSEHADVFLMVLPCQEVPAVAKARRACP